MAWFFCRRTNSVNFGMNDGKLLHAESIEEAAKEFARKFRDGEDEIDVWPLPEEPTVVMVSRKTTAATLTKKKGRG